MKLYLNATSPYARLVRIVLIEKGLSDAVTLKWCDPWADDRELLAVNPAGRVPALLTQEGATLSESQLIAIYLDRTYPKTPILPADQWAEVLHITGLGQNLMEAAFNTVIARKHGGSEMDSSVLGERRGRAIQRLLQQLGHEFDGKPLTTTIDLGDITTAVALEYLAFRLPEVAWQAEHPQLAVWHAGVTMRESFQQTAFV
ncbi:glutathione S-transferase family protein [Vreelandella sp. EE27]